MSFCANTLGNCHRIEMRRQKSINEARVTNLDDVMNIRCRSMGSSIAYIYKRLIWSDTKIDTSDSHRINKNIFLWTIDCSSTPSSTSSSSTTQRTWMMIRSKGNAQTPRTHTHTRLHAKHISAAQTISQSRMSIHLIFYHAHSGSAALTIARNVCQFMFDTRPTAATYLLMLVRFEN